MSTPSTASSHARAGAREGVAERAWRASASWFEAVLRHPFVTGLGDGTLPEVAFARYLVDDAHYLDRYARVLAHLATRAAAPADVELLAVSAAGAVAAERTLHTGWLADRGVDPDADDAPEPTPTCQAYTGHLLEQAVSAPFDVALAAVLPCFRVYAEVGRRLQEPVAAAGPDHPYAAWVATYADPDFDVAVRRAEDCLDRTVNDERAVVATYVRSARYEWMFWDAAWRGERWPSPDGTATAGDEGLSDASRR